MVHVLLSFNPRFRYSVPYYFGFYLDSLILFRSELVSFFSFFQIHDLNPKCLQSSSFNLVDRPDMTSVKLQKLYGGDQKKKNKKIKNQVLGLIFYSNPGIPSYLGTLTINYAHGNK